MRAGALRLLHGRQPRLRQVGLVDESSAVTAAQARLAGVIDFLPWPIDQPALAAAVADIRDRLSAAADPSAAPDSADAVFAFSPAMQEALRLLPAISDVFVGVPHGSLLSTGIFVLYAAVLLQGLFLYNRNQTRRQQERLSSAVQARDSVAQRAASIERELSTVRSRLSQVEPADSAKAEEIRSLESERVRLRDKLRELAEREAQLRASAARTKLTNSGCPRRGLDVNSGWNWQPKNHGWSASSIISHRSPAASLFAHAPTTSPADSRRGR